MLCSQECEEFVPSIVSPDTRNQKGVCPDRSQEYHNLLHRKDDVNTDCRRLLLQLAGYFKQDSYTAGTIIGSVDGGMMMLGIIFIGIRAAVPVCTKQYSLACVRIVSSYNIAGFQESSVISHQIGVLVVDFGSELFKLFGQIFSASFMGVELGTRGPKAVCAAT